MPWWQIGGRLRRPATCQRKITWSYSRGGCRLEPGHPGACRPAGRGSRGFWPSVPPAATVGRTRR